MKCEGNRHIYPGRKAVKCLCGKGKDRHFPDRLKWGNSGGFAVSRSHRQKLTETLTMYRLLTSYRIDTLTLKTTPTLRGSESPSRYGSE